MSILIVIVFYLFVGIVLSVLTQAELWEFPVTVPFWLVIELYYLSDIIHSDLAEKHRKKQKKG